MAEALAFEADTDRAESDPLLVVDVGGFEGPLDLLLDLARRQKVDLHEVSILALADQYLAFVETARSMRLELAADYLVMAAWLAYLKSRLLLPEPPKPEGPSASDLATALALRLRRLEAIRKAAQLLSERPQLGREVFGRGGREAPAEPGDHGFTASLYDLLSAYANLRQRNAITQVIIERRKVWSLVDARELLTRMLGEIGDWTALQHYLLPYLPPEDRVTATASAFAASLELVREGKLEMRQEGPYQPIYLRKGQGTSRGPDGGTTSGGQE